MNSRRLSLKAFFIILIACVLFIPSSSTEITEPIRDGDYIYIDDSKTFLKSTYSATHGDDIEHWAMPKTFTGDCDMAIGFDGKVAWPTKVLLEDPHYEYWDTNKSKTFYYVTNFAVTAYTQDYGNLYNPQKYKFDHKIHIGYDNATNESIWQDVIGTVVYFDSQENDGTNYTITWHTEHSRLEQYRDISNRILSNPIEYEFDGKNLWFITKNITMTANEMRHIIIEMGGKIELGEHSYKYDIMWKPSHQSIPEARTAGNIYVLDPYLNSSWLHMKEIELTGYAGAGTDYQVELEIGDSAGGDFHLEGHCTNFPQDIRITDDDGTSLRDYWIEDITADPIKMWIEVADDLGSNQTIRIYYGKSGEVTDSNISNTFLFGDDFPGSSINTGKWDGDTGYASVSGGILTYSSTTPKIITSISQFGPNLSVRTKFKAHTGTEYMAQWGVRNPAGAHFALSYVIPTQNIIYCKDGTTSTEPVSNWPTDTWYVGDLNIIGGTSVTGYKDGVEVQGSPVTNYPPDTNDLEVWFAGREEAGGINFQSEWIVVRKYNSPEPAFASAGAEQSVVDSIYYNNTNSYNLTIESDGTIISNRSVVAADDINDTASSTGTTYLQVINFDNAASIVRNFTISGDDVDWYQAANLSGSYIMKNSSGTVQTVADGNFTVNLVAGDYWIESAEPTIISYSPETPVSSAEGENQTFSITTNVLGNVTWYIDSVEVFNETDVNSSSYSNSTALAGVYNVTVVTTNTNGSNSMTWDWTVILLEKIPLSIFIMWSVIMCVGVIIGFMTTGLYGITSSLLTATIAYMNSKNIINGNVVQYFSGISTSDTIVVGYRTIESLPMSYIYLFIAIVMVIVFILQVKNEIQYNLEPDMDGEFFDE